MALARTLTAGALVAVCAVACAATALAAGPVQVGPAQSGPVQAGAVQAGAGRAGRPVPVPVVTPTAVAVPGRAGAEPDTTRLANPSTGTRLAVNGESVVLTDRASDADSWEVDQTPEGVRVRNTAADRCLTAPAADARPGARVGLRACDGAPDQRWALRPSGDGGWTLARGADRDLVLGVGYDGDRPATAVFAPATADPRPEHVWAVDHRPAAAH
ncbi:RICIN domain-containing protein [Saccharothrix sp. Mg75]|uniref:RICIN domain-containing protein n=1 Tax=Saccharothrix sp. Mg75 TaxID=3445357 RepID=UPI003EE8F54F